MNSLTDYSSANLIPFVDNNMVSCLSGVDTRLLSILVVHFDASLLNTLFTDYNCSMPVKGPNETINCWKSTSQSACRTNALLRNNSFPMLETFTTNNYGVNLIHAYGGGACFEYNCDLSRFKNATCIVVFKINKTLDVIGHPISHGAGFIRYRNNTYEQFYTDETGNGFTELLNIFPTYSAIIYAITANESENLVSMYRYYSSLVYVCSAGYSTNTRDSPLKYLGSPVNYR
jgi:hypothetical protein